MKLGVTVVLLFIFAITIRLYNFGNAGTWSDEEALVDKGHIVIELLLNGDLKNSYWVNEAAGHTLLTTYVYGLASYKDLEKPQPQKITLNSYGLKKEVFNYDLFYSRFVSVVVSSLAVILIFFIGVYYFSFFIGVIAAMILAMLPHFLGYSQMVTYESFVLPLFTACVFTYFLYLEKNKKYLLIITGILTGLTLATKESTGIIVGLYFITYFIWKKLTNKKNIKLRHVIYICAIGFITFFIIEFPIFFDLKEYSHYVYSLWFKDSGLIPELILGRRMGAHFFYYFVAVLVTTPTIILFLTSLGIKLAYNKKKKWVFSALLVWFLIPFSMLFFHHRQHMVRYIIEIYAPMALLAALGLEYLIAFFTKIKFIKYIFIISLFVYLTSILLIMTPYYLEYYNELVGGTKNVYEKKLFFLGWFGEGLKKPGEYVATHASKNAKIGLKIEPYPTSLYRSSLLHYENFNPKTHYNYVIVNYYAVIRAGFDDKTLLKDYEIVYSEKVDGIDLVRVYKRKF